MIYIRQGIYYARLHMKFSVSLMLIVCALSTSFLLLIGQWWSAYIYAPSPEFSRIIHLRTENGISKEQIKYYLSKQQSFKYISRAIDSEITLNNGQKIHASLVDPVFFKIFNIPLSKGNALEMDGNTSQIGNVIVNNKITHKNLQIKDALENKNQPYLQAENGSYKIIGIVNGNIHFPVNTSIWKLIDDNDFLNFENLNLSAVGLLKPETTLKSARREFSQTLEEFNLRNNIKPPIIKLEKFSDYANSNFIFDLKIISTVLWCLLISGIICTSGHIYTYLLKKNKEWKISNLIGIPPKSIIITPIYYLMLMLVLGGAAGLILYEIIKPIITTHELSSHQNSPFWWKSMLSLPQNIILLVVLVLSVGLASVGFTYIHLHRQASSKITNRIGRNNKNWFENYYWFLLIVQSIAAVAVVYFLLMLCKAYYYETIADRGYKTKNIIVSSIKDNNISLTKVNLLASLDSLVKDHSDDVAISNAIPGSLDTAAYLNIAMENTENLKIPVMGIEASDTFFQVFDIKLNQGRIFNELDNLDSPKVVIIDRLMAEKYWPNESAIGKEIMFFPEIPLLRKVHRIVGVADNIRGNPYNLSTIYIPLKQGIANPNKLNIIMKVNDNLDRKEKTKLLNSNTLLFNNAVNIEEIIKKSGSPYISRIIIFLPSCLFIIAMLIICISSISRSILATKKREIAIYLCHGLSFNFIKGRVLKKFNISLAISSFLAIIFLNTNELSSFLYFFSGSKSNNFILIILCTISVSLIEFVYISFPLNEKINSSVTELLKTTN